MLISAVSSDVCSSDRAAPVKFANVPVRPSTIESTSVADGLSATKSPNTGSNALVTGEIGSATRFLYRILKYPKSILSPGTLTGSIDDDRLNVVARSGDSEAHTSALHSLMRISYAVFCSNKKILAD